MLTILINFTAYSQNVYLDETDTNLVFLTVHKDSYTRVSSKDHYAFYDKNSYKNFIDTNKVSNIDSIEDFDFSNRTLVLLNYRGVDCHSRFNIRLIKDEEKKLYDIVVRVIYGGCRAGGRAYSAWISIPRVPYDYTLQSTRLIFDNESERLFE
jgi:hypothetical protein